MRYLGAATDLDGLATRSLSGMLRPVQHHCSGSETFTITSGSVTKVAGTTIQGQSVYQGQRILIMTAPTTTGTGNSYNPLPAAPNGIYSVTSVTSDINLVRADDMSVGNPAGLTVFSENYSAAWGSQGLYTVGTPDNSTGSFTWGTDNISFINVGGRNLNASSLYVGAGRVGMWNNAGISTYLYANTSASNSGDQTLTLPAPTTDTLVSRESTDTLKNKDLTDASNTLPAPAWADITGKPSTFTPATHGHSAGDITGLTKSSVGLSNVDNTADSAKTVATAAALTTARKISGVSFDGSADITVDNGLWLPSDFGFKAYNFDPMLVNYGTYLAPGTLHLMRVKIPAATTITNLHFWIAVGDTLTSGQCFGVLYQGGAKLAATASQHGSWNTAGFKTAALSSPQSVAAGDVYVGFVYNGTSALRVGGAPIEASNYFGNGGVSSGFRWATANTGLTTTTPTNYSTPAAWIAKIWAGLS